MAPDLPAPGADNAEVAVGAAQVEGADGAPEVGPAIGVPGQAHGGEGGGRGGHGLWLSRSDVHSQPGRTSVSKSDAQLLALMFWIAFVDGESVATVKKGRRGGEREDSMLHSRNLATPSWSTMYTQ